MAAAAAAATVATTTAVAGVFLAPPPPLRPPFETSTTTTAAAVSTVLALLTRQTPRLSALPAGGRLPPRRPLPTARDAEEGVDRPHFHRMPTPPWMTTPLLLPPEQELDLSNPGRSKTKPLDAGEPDGSLTGKVRGGRGRKAMRLIVRSVNKLHRLRQPDDAAPACPSPSPQDDSPIGAMEGLLEAIRVDRCEKSSGKKVPWARAEKKLGFPRLKKEKAPTAAEMSLDPAFLARLRGEAAAVRKWVKVKKAGVTECKVEEVRRFWREGELAMVRFDEPLCRNMERAHEIVEAKTGGLVVWCKKNTLVVYRGSDCRQPSEFSSVPTPSPDASEDLLLSQDGSPASMGSIDDGLIINGTLYEREGDRLLDGLGPRFIDWWGPKPLPVDADLLPEVVPGFRPPLRIYPPGMREKLTDYELTYYRKIARPLPTHFVLGRNSKLQGLADAILKLWEKSLIAKIAVKYGVPNTNNEKMASELKQLTGGVLILRNKYFIIFFRGKDFLPGKIANLISEREQMLTSKVFLEEDARLEAAKTLEVRKLPCIDASTSGTLAEFQAIQNSLSPKDISWETRLQISAEKEMLEKELKRLQSRHSILKLKVGKSEKKLMKLDSEWISSRESTDQELLTEEERQNFQKIGSKMTELLVLGRRGIYDGVIGSIHQHWKHREIVKVITMQENFSQIMKTARLLETESGGILVSVEKLKRGHAILIYRGKNYQRPLKLLPSNLLTKRKALSRSIEIQRRGSLKFFAHQKQLKISELKGKLKDVEHRAKRVLPTSSR